VGSILHEVAPEGGFAAQRLATAASAESSGVAEVAIDVNSLRVRAKGACK